MFVFETHVGLYKLTYLYYILYIFLKRYYRVRCVLHFECFVAKSFLNRIIFFDLYLNDYRPSALL